jgi:Flp pilus assembly protein TadD
MQRPAHRHLTIAALILTAGVAVSACSQSFEDDLLDTGPQLSAFTASQAAVRARAKAYFRQADYALAERTFRQAIAKDGHDSEAWLGLAAADDRLGHFADADKAYAQVLALSGRRAEVVNNMAFSQLLRGNRDGARALFAEAAKLAPDNPVIAANAATLTKPVTAKS